MCNLRKLHLLRSQFNKMSVDVLKSIFLKSVESVQPRNLIQHQVSLKNGHLVISNRTFPLRKPCYIVGFGKAVLGMALEIENLLDKNLKMGVVTIPQGILKNTKFKSKIKFIEGATNNIPDQEALTGALEIKSLVEVLSEEDLVLVLMSGGGSALLPLPKPPITLEEKQNLIKELSNKGANIIELNCVRKRISVLKGGGLAELAYPAKVISLVLSDIVGDPLEFIASGPTTPNFDNIDDAIAVIMKYKCYKHLPESIKTVLQEKKSTRNKFEHVYNFIIGNNQTAAEAARKYATTLGFQSVILSTSIGGDVAEISKIYANMASVICNSSNKQAVKEFVTNCGLEIHPDFVEVLNKLDFTKEICIIAAGEPTVVVKGGGKGGRNQQLALEFSLRLNKLNIKSADISFLSGGTDGIDGPTDAAGAIGTSDLVNNSLAQNIKIEHYLNNNDSYSFFEKFNGGEYLIKTGHTGTNVMDVHVMLIKPKQN